jgi:hypothetical protein
MIFVQSKRAALRVLESVTTMIEKRLKLRVNHEKSRVAPAFHVSLLGFSYYLTKSGVKIRVSSKAVKRLRVTIRRFTSRTWGVSMDHRLDKLGRYTTGWVAYFKLADSPRVFDEIDQWTRRRLRQAQWVQWKTTNRKSSMLRKLGYELGNRKMGSLRKRHWFASGLKPLDFGMNNAYWEAQGYRSFKR